jgi:hypothetical protein
MMHGHEKNRVLGRITSVIRLKVTPQVTSAAEEGSPGKTHPRPSLRHWRGIRAVASCGFPFAPFARHPVVSR